MRIAMMAVFLSILCGCTGAAHAEPEERFADFGTGDDFSAGQPIHIDPDSPWFWGSDADGGFAIWENAERFYWATKPVDPSGYTNARLLQHHHDGAFRVRAFQTGIDERATLAIRYKDNLLAPVGIYTKGTIGKKKIGEIGGAFDHRWKTAVLAIERGDLPEKGGFYNFRIAESDYGGMRGFLYIDWIRLLNHGGFAPPHDTDGYWPAPPGTDLGAFPTHMKFRADGEPTFVVGVMVKGMRVGSWKAYAAAGVNHIDLQSWELEWLKSKKGLYADERFADRARFGFPDWVSFCREANIGCSAQFFTDTRAWWLQKAYKGEYDMLATLESVVRAYKDEPANRLWYPVDEPDHDDATWGEPPEFVGELARSIREHDRATPILVNFQAWKPDVYRLYEHGFDIAAFDVYPLGAGRPIIEIAQRLDDLREQVGERKGRYAIVEAHDGANFDKTKRQLAALEVVAQGYLSITHGAHGVIYFIDKEGTYIDPADMPMPFAGIKQFATEITNRENGLMPFLVPPAEEIARTGAPGGVKLNDGGVHFTLRKRPDGTHALIAQNVTAKPIQARFEIPGLAAGKTVEIRFEDRELKASGGAIADTIPPLSRRVYVFGP
ncbi:hypothetical protein K8I61_02055 [bacterium]|nr:hypothetical protein [bacterium]